MEVEKITEISVGQVEDILSKESDGHIVYDLQRNYPSDASGTLRIRERPAGFIEYEVQLQGQTVAEGEFKDITNEELADTLRRYGSDPGSIGKLKQKLRDFYEAVK